MCPVETVAYLSGHSHILHGCGHGGVDDRLSPLPQLHEHGMAVMSDLWRFR